MRPQPIRVFLPQPPGTTAVECWRLPATPAAFATVRPWLAGYDLRQARRHRDPGRRRSFLIGCGLLRWMLSRHLGLAPQRVPLLRLPNRRPRHRSGGWLDSCALSVSHSRGWVLAGMLPGAGLGRRLGLDVEDGDRTPATGLNRRLPWHDAVSGSRLLQRWTLAEAALKADGHGLPALSRLRLDGPDGSGWRLETDHWTIRSAPIVRLPGIPRPRAAVALARRTRR